ncbi:MAG TPA: lysophospholipid acyltransferase family protein [Phnomibacter sp.]|nr:lysophospholipid acyltransferase family protein [Phnomibacter sp.]
MLYFVKRFVQIIYCIYAFAVFVAIMLALMPAVLVAMVLGQPHGGNLIIHLCRFWSDLWLLLIGIRHQNIFEEPINKNEHYVFVSNHISYLDIPLMFQTIRHNTFRVLGKIELSRVPVFGILYKLAVVLVDRSNPEKRAASVSLLKKVLNHNISIFLFPEGTFNETGHPLKSFYDGAFRIAIETNTPIKPIVNLNANDRMHHHSVWKLTPGRNKAVILPAIPVDGLTLSDLPILKNRVYHLMESTIIEYTKQHESVSQS